MGPGSRKQLIAGLAAESSTKTTDHDITSFDAAVDRGTRMLESTAPPGIAAAESPPGSDPEVLT